jgi:hypothetical protein
MITLFVNGKPLGTWAEAERLFQETDGTQNVEFRDSSGRVIALSAPAAEPEWASRITPEETQRRMAGEFVTFEEMKKRLGWE